MKNDHYGYTFGQRDELGRFHPGTDYNGPGSGDADEGTPILCIGPGKVSYTAEGYDSGWGNHLFVRHEIKAFLASLGLSLPAWCPEVVFSHYAHLKQINVKVDQQVDEKTVLGLMGKTGSANLYGKKGRTWTAHLHWEVRKAALGVTYYPPASLSAADFHAKFFDPEQFVKDLNAYVATASPAAPAGTDALAEAKARIKADEQAILALVDALTRIGKTADVSAVMAGLPWLKK